ncbi:hypothetical protein [Halospeciosus flavus]|uniref:Twin-arginine translocation signal domain-containing protein n=1 Tax=Halospeciosus flavus TaxID=3032283 RepID=A0ABD5Z3X3_9EURY|nr:hypothetical protein [Halospeciosus flavus]
MGETDQTRRTFLKAAGGVAATAAGGAAVVQTTSAATASSWSEVSSPVSKTLYGVSDTVNGHVAVGKAGNILHRRNGSWQLVYNSGPATRSNSMRTCAVTDDGKRVWFAGSSGAMGTYDVNTGVKTNYSYPKEKTSTWEAITVTGNANSETVYVANGSGEILKGSMDSDGCMQWGNVMKPGSGSNIPAIDFREANVKVGHACDTSGNAFETKDAGGTWSDIGVPNAQVAFYDLISFATGDGTKHVYITAGGGKVYRLDCDCNRWTPIDLGNADLRSIDRKDTGDKFVVGSGGTAYHKAPSSDWEPVKMPVSDTLNEMSYGAHFGNDTPDVVVGNNGTILER